MEQYIVTKGDTFQSISDKINLTDSGKIREYHNLNSLPNEIIGFELKSGTKLKLPPEEKVEVYNVDNSNKEQQEKFKEKEKKEKEESPEESEHDGKHFVVQKGKTQCDKGNQFPCFKVTSQDHHYWNDKEGKSDFLSVTENDLTFNPPGPSFGQCKLKPSSGGYLPCAFAPAGKWTKTYDKTQISNQKCVTEISQLQCATGGKITIKSHGQIGETSKSDFQKTEIKQHNALNPFLDMDEFQDELNDESYYH